MQVVFYIMPDGILSSWSPTWHVHTTVPSVTVVARLSEHKLERKHLRGYLAPNFNVFRLRIASFRTVWSTWDRICMSLVPKNVQEFCF